MDDYGTEIPYCIPEREKRAGESRDFTIPWAVLLNGDTIAASSWTAADLTIEDSSSTDSTTTVRLSGGEGGRTYKVYNTITTASGYVYRRVFVLAVTGKVTAPITVPDPSPGVGNVLLFGDGDYVLFGSQDFFGLGGGAPSDDEVTTPANAFKLGSGDHFLLGSGDYLVTANG